MLLVAGGSAGPLRLLSSTEILRTINGNYWTMVASLPNSMQKLSGATLGNTVFMTGEYSLCLCAVNRYHVV